jgi:hypothetical protein
LSETEEEPLTTKLPTGQVGTTLPEGAQPVNPGAGGLKKVRLSGRTT